MVYIRPIECAECGMEYPHHKMSCKTQKKILQSDSEAVNHPQHYGGDKNPHEAIKVIEHYNLNFNLGNVVKYVLRSGKKGSTLEDLEKAKWYISREIERLIK